MRCDSHVISGQSNKPELIVHPDISFSLPVRVMRPMNGASSSRFCRVTLRAVKAYSSAKAHMGWTLKELLIPWALRVVVALSASAQEIRI
jgi:hypothetical protein